MTIFNEKNLVIGFATNQDLDRVHVFCNTIRKLYSHTECQVILAVNQPSVFQVCLNYDVLPIVSASKYYNKISTREKLLNRSIVFALNTSVFFVKSNSKFNNYRDIIFEAILHPHLSRWFFYKRVLESIPAPRKILITDVSDVFFQAPFFENLRDDKLSLFSESYPYGNSPWNDTNYKNLYGGTQLQKIIGRPVACMGVIGGGTAPVRALIDWMIASAYAQPTGGSDQVRGNRYAHSEGPTDSIKISENGADAVIHIHDDKLIGTDVRSIAYLNHSFIFDSRTSRVIPIVHMYNRNSETLRIALAKNT